LYPPFAALPLHLLDEFLDFAGAIAEKPGAAGAASQANHRQARHLARRVVAHPIDRNAQPFCYLLRLEQMIVTIHRRAPRSSKVEHGFVEKGEWERVNG
jgi:hypothetical protein